MTTAAEFAIRADTIDIGNGKYLASCTSGTHLDAPRSMLVADDENGKVFLRCYACRATQACMEGAVILGYIDAPRLPRMEREPKSAPVADSATTNQNIEREQAIESVDALQFGSEA